MKKIHLHKSLLGKSRSQVMAIIGNEHNNYSSDVWEYTFTTGWWFNKKVVIVMIYFENDKVIYIRKYYDGIKNNVSHIHKIF